MAMMAYLKIKCPLRSIALKIVLAYELGAQVDETDFKMAISLTPKPQDSSLL